MDHSDEIWKVSDPLSPIATDKKRRQTLFGAGQTAQMLRMDEIHFAPPKKPWNSDSPVNTNNGFLWFQSGAKWISSIHSIKFKVT